MHQTLLMLLTSTALALVGAVPAMAQETTGVPGSPSATTTIDGKQLPPPPPEFGGVIEETAKDSKPWWPPRVVVIKSMGQTAEIRTHFLAACFRRSTSACETSPA
jgi:arylsulfatase